MAGSHVIPPSTETSTLASTALRVARRAADDNGSPLCTVEFTGGDTIAEVGGVWSLVPLVCWRPGCRLQASTPMSANRFTVACRISRLGAAPFGLSWSVSRPHDHCTVPAPNTSALLGARYSVRLCVAVPTP